MNAAKNYILLAVSVAFFIWFVLKFSPPVWTPLKIAGAAIGAPAFLLWVLARLRLGASFSLTPQAHELVTRGIYSKIRNPIYVFSSLFILGLILYSGRLALLAVFAIILPLQIIRILAEQKVLEAKFGDAYRDYKKRTWF